MANKERTIEWVNRYLNTSKADCTIWGFEYDGYVWAFEPSKDTIIERARITRASTKKGGGEKLALNKLTTVQRQALTVSGIAKVICTVASLEKEAKEYGLNKGCAFEQIISLMNGQGLYKKGDRRGYWECGDVVIEGKQVQVKFEQASLSEFKTIEKAEKIIVSEEN